MTQYLAKFLPNLSDLTKPLRDLTKKDVVFTWDAPQDAVFRTLKEAITQVPVLKYYNINEEITLECDASQYGLGAAMKTKWSACCIRLSSTDADGKPVRSN